MVGDSPLYDAAALTSRHKSSISFRKTPAAYQCHRPFDFPPHPAILKPMTPHLNAHPESPAWRRTTRLIDCPPHGFDRHTIRQKCPVAARSQRTEPANAKFHPLINRSARGGATHQSEIAKENSMIACPEAARRDHCDGLADQKLTSHSPSAGIERLISSRWSRAMPAPMATHSRGLSAT